MNFSVNEFAMNDDGTIMRLICLFETENLYGDMELNLLYISQRLGAA